MGFFVCGLMLWLVDRYAYAVNGIDFPMAGALLKNESDIQLLQRFANLFTG